MNSHQFLIKFLFIFLILTALTLTLSACELSEEELEAVGSLEAGPLTWIEYPPEGEVFTMGAIPITVYAASPDGVGSINVMVDGQPAPAGELTSLVGDSTMVRTDLHWQPPAEGQYRIVASAGGGAPTYLSFCVVTCDKSETEESDQPGPTTTPTATLPIITLAPDEPTWTPTATPAASYTPTATPANSETPTPTATAYHSPTPTAYTESSAEFWAAPPYLNSGECTTLNWNVYGDFQAIYFEGSSVSASGSDSECPAESYTYHLQVVEMDNSYSDQWASVEVSAPPPTDSSGPTINWTNLVWESCQFYGEAGISDESGVSWAQFYYNKNGEGWASIWMSELSTEYWQSDYGVSVGGEIGTPIGTVDYYVIASDSLGNQSESGIASYSYMSCDG
jgi:hypothetical protein